MKILIVLCLLMGLPVNSLTAAEKMNVFISADDLNGDMPVLWKS